jgi:hypothetical protein
MKTSTKTSSNEMETDRSDTVLQPNQEDISRRARDLWEQYNRPENRDEEIWLEAERQLTQESRLLSARSEAKGSSTVSISDPNSSRSRKSRSAAAR